MDAPGFFITFAVQPVPAKPKMRLQIEVAKNGMTPSNCPNATAPAGTGRASLTVHNVGDGSYRWWARFYDGSAISPWVRFSSGPAFKIDRTAPAVPVITSSTDPVQGKTYRSGSVSLARSSTDSGSGISKYSYTFAAQSQPTATATKATSLAMTQLPSGNYVLSLKAQDHAGNWSSPATYRVRLDTTAPTICSPSCYGFSAFAFNPHYNAMTFNYVVSEPATVRIGVYGQNNHRVRLVVQHSPGSKQIMHFTWHGRDDHGNLVVPGTYSYVVRTTDSYGNSNAYTYSTFRCSTRSSSFPLPSRGYGLPERSRRDVVTRDHRQRQLLCNSPWSVHDPCVLPSVHIQESRSGWIVLLLSAVAGELLYAVPDPWVLHSRCALAHGLWARNQHAAWRSRIA